MNQENNPNTPSPGASTSTPPTPDTPRTQVTAADFLSRFPRLQDIVQHLTHDYAPLSRRLQESEEDQDLLAHICTALDNHLQETLVAKTQAEQNLAAVQNVSNQQAENLTTLRHEHNMTTQTLTNLQQESQQLHNEREAMSQRFNSLQSQNRQQETTIAQLQTQLQNMITERDKLAKQVSQDRPQNPWDTVGQHYASPPMTPRPTAPDTPIFSGETKDPATRQDEYTNWKTSIRVKLTMDRAAFPAPADRLLYTAQRLQGAAFTRVRAKVDEITNNPTNPSSWTHDWRDYNDMFKYLDEVYVTHDTLAQAHRDFTGLTQDQRSYADFISLFTHYADQSNQPAEIQVVSLQQKVNNELRKALVPVISRPGQADVTGWIKLFRELSNNIADEKFLRKSGHQPSSTGGHVYRPAPSPPPAHDPDAMQLDMVSTSKRRVRGPLDDAEKARRREKDLCMYCGGQGHYAFNCPNRVHPPKPQQNRQGKD